MMKQYGNLDSHPFFFFLINLIKTINKIQINLINKMISQITLIATLTLNHKLDTLQMIYFPIFFNNGVFAQDEVEWHQIETFIKYG